MPPCTIMSCRTSTITKSQENQLNDKILFIPSIK